jgi:periplasmic protein TonB
MNLNLGIAPYFRRFELPWGLSEESEQKFVKLLRILLIIATIFAILIYLLPQPERTKVKPEDLSERVVQLIVQPKPPPPPPPPIPEEKPKPEEVVKPVEQKPVEKPKPQLRKEMRVFEDQFADLRDAALDIQDPQMKTPVEDARSERNLITSQAGKASGGITDRASAGFGGGSGAIGAHTTTSVQHGKGLDPNAGGRVTRTGSSGKASRAREEVEIMFDKNKGALYALYGRALRDQPELQGKIVLEFTIAPSGEITACRVVSSELNDPELEKKIVARVRLIRFKAGDVEPLTVSKPIDFFPRA